MELESKLANLSEGHNRRLSAGSINRDDTDSDEPEKTEAEKAKEKAFASKRAQHYNMREQMLKARQLLADEDDEDDE